MRAVLITTNGVEQRYVGAALKTALGDQLIGVVLEQAQPNLRKQVTRYAPLRVIERILTKISRTVLRYPQRTASALHRVLGPCEPNWPALQITTHSANSVQAQTFIRQCQPTHLLIYGTGIVRGKTLSLAPVALNLHTGLSPWYRGSDTEFWPLYHRQPHKLGVTVHECTAALDGGAIYGWAKVNTPVRNAFEAFAQCVKIGAILYANIATRLANGETWAPEPQDLSKGRCYKFIDRTLFHDLRMEFRR